jgi:hypothetical protein
MRSYFDVLQVFLNVGHCFKMQEREKEVEQSLPFFPADLLRFLLGYTVERWPASWERGMPVDVFYDDTWHPGVCCRFKGEKVLIHINGKLPQWCDKDQIAPPGSHYCLYKYDKYET